MPGSTEFVKVAKVGDVADGDMISVWAGSTEVLLARIGDEYFAADNACTHTDAMLSMGILYPEICQVECPLHEGIFDLRTGEAIQEPPEDPLPVYTVKVEGDDIMVGPPNPA
jgi:nitrite reductase/ring-hydroxylating ferredoxin subunit